METIQIGKKCGLEQFLITQTKDVSENPDAISAFLAELDSDNNTLNRIVIDGRTRVQRIYMPIEIETDETLDSLVLAASGAGHFDIFEPAINGFSMGFDTAAYKNLPDAFDVKKTGSSFYMPYATQIKINSTQLSAYITVNQKGKIYTVEALDRNSAAELRESDFWEGLGKKNSLKLDEIRPQYTGRIPITPWYQAEDRDSGAVLTMGPGYMVDEIKAEFKNPVSAIRLRELFGEIAADKYVNGKYTNKYMSKDGTVKTFKIDAETRSDTRLYVGYILNVARQG
jgi:hypothetical protein